MPNYIFKDQSSSEHMEVSIHNNTLTVGITTPCDKDHVHYEQNKVLIFREEALELAKILLEHFDPTGESLQTQSLPLIVINPVKNDPTP